MSDATRPPSRDDESDDALDGRIRAATEALLALAPADRLDGMAARVERDLAEIDRRGTGAASRMESRMMSDADQGSGRDAPMPTTKPRNEDSGLHDIKALAQDTRKRISRRITSQHDIDPALLSASHSGLRAVALPEPALVVSLPEVPASMEEVRAAAHASTATASEGATVTPIAARKRTGLYVGLGAIGLAAAAAIAVVATGGGGKKSGEGTQEQAGTVAMATGSAAPSAGSAAEVRQLQAEGDRGAVAAAPGAGAAPAAAPPAADSVGGMGAGSAAALADTERPDDRARREEAKRAATASAAGGAAAGDKAETGKPDGAKPDGAKPGKGSGADAAAVKPTGGGAGAASAKGDPKSQPKPPPSGKPGEKSIEDLLNDASGGPAKPKDEPGGGGGGGDSAPAKPDKTGLDSKDIKAGMGAVAGKAQACYGQHGVEGHVKVRATVAPSGQVTKVDATGEFAGTPTGACVAAAVKGASFPEWTGASMTVTYSFTLQEM